VWRSWRAIHSGSIFSTQSRGRKDIDRLTLEEVEALGDLAVEMFGDFGVELQAMVLWGAYTCMRTAEVFAARHSRLHGDVYNLREQFNRKLGRETEPKHGSVGRIFVPDAAREAVLAKPRRLDDDLMFRTKRGKQFRQESFGYYWGPLRAAFTRTPSRSGPTRGSRWSSCSACCAPAASRASRRPGAMTARRAAPWGASSSAVA
jgi:integrase